MGTHRILLDDEAYARLDAARRDGETYSDAVVRLLERAQLTDYFGALDEETAEALADVIIADEDLVDVIDTPVDPEDRPE
ncbi:MAG: antitoxin VapB family protein [Halobacteriales archaeon]